MPVERAVALIHAAGVGAVTTLLAIPEEERDPQLSSGLLKNAPLVVVAVGGGMTPQGSAIPSRMGSKNGNVERIPKPVAIAEVRKRSW